MITTNGWRLGNHCFMVVKDRQVNTNLDVIVDYFAENLTVDLK